MATNALQLEDMMKNVTTGQRIESFLGGSQYRPYIGAAVGVAAALGTGYAIKKTVQKANERRVKKQDPVEYLKYKPTFDRLKKYQPKVYQRLIRYQLNVFIQLGTLKLKTN